MTEREQQLLHLDGRTRALTLAELEDWGRVIGVALPRPTIVTLAGDLGAGKTTLVRAICAGIGVSESEPVTSPTYALLHQYDAPDGPVTHADLYRLRSTRELEALGFDELVDTAPVLLVEWPERAESSLPDHTIVITLAHDPLDPTRRLVRGQVKGQAGHRIDV